MVGCDGGRSAARRELGIAFEGASYHRYFMLADVDIHWDGPHDEGAFFLGAGEGYVGVAPIPGARRYRFFVEISEQLSPEHARKELSLETFQRLASARGQRMTLSEASSMTIAEFRHRMVNQLQSGRVFLAGDAAHIGSPIGGQYMNLGINEAYNLGWKLAYVSLDRADARLLDSYHAERMPVAREAERTAHILTRLFTVSHPVGLFVRNHLLPVISQLPHLREHLPRGVSGHAFRYRAGGAIAEQVAPARVQRPAEKRRKLRVRAGDLAPEVILSTAGSRPAQRLSGCFDGKHCVLLLFAGEVELAERFAWLMQLGQRILQRYPAVRPCIVWPSEPSFEAPSSLPVLVDHDGRVYTPTMRQAVAPSFWSAPTVMWATRVRTASKPTLWFISSGRCGYAPRQKTHASKALQRRCLGWRRPKRDIRTNGTAVRAFGQFPRRARAFGACSAAFRQAGSRFAGGSRRANASCHRGRYRARTRGASLGG